MGDLKEVVDEKTTEIVNILMEEANLKSPFRLNKTSLLQAYFLEVTWKKLLRRMQSLKIVTILRKEVNLSVP